MRARSIDVSIHHKRDEKDKPGFYKAVMID